ncbi:Naphthalene 1,2-dioxygenase system ferredoxin subunit [Pigmentiphaga humi]|uniref:Naphthalene 1,2-dioxygenase system ferredoxin subunit n=1 Tax=Pigmentiphaga humi TaxID=2478468 RepID=A0A3P4B054_9BURK|nr:non-heme iron oxygenase ferredoxin subunit [Pigmentiphaga humi]VCU69432.1 Naphthalene 1,2-dioxygenase system ferredoxin subunit [Pigmentiphaga humi]
MVWCQAAKVDDVPEGDAISVCVEGEPLALYKLEGRIYATHDLCTHAKAHLAEGFVSGDCVECPLHEGVFHIPTGRPVSGPVSIPIRVYPVRIEEDTVLVDLTPAGGAA